MKTLNGFYRGIIVQNNDPLKLGRVKVFVPHLHLSLLDLESSDYNKDFYFSEFGKNYNQSDPNLIDMTKYMEKIKPKLPWAEVSLPTTGSGFSSYNASSNNATISDGPSENGSPAGALFQSNPPKDKFPQNVSGGSYAAQAYYNSPKGFYGIPEVNTKVWLFFIAGNSNAPVVFGFSPSPRTYAQVYDATSYPSNRENERGSGDSIRRNKIAMNYRGGSLTIDGTTNKEEVSLAHDSGSFCRFNNSGKSDLIVGEQQTLVKGNGFLTVEGKQYCYYEEGIETTIGPSGLGSVQNFGGGLGALASGGLGSLASGGLASLASGGLGSLASGFFNSSLGSLNLDSVLNDALGSVSGSLSTALGSLESSVSATLNNALGSATSSLNTALGSLESSVSTTLTNNLNILDNTINKGLTKLDAISIKFSDIPNSNTKNINNYVGKIFKSLEDNKFYKIISS
jgi:hypothetical protein